MVNFLKIESSLAKEMFDRRHGVPRRSKKKKLPRPLSSYLFDRRLFVRSVIRSGAVLTDRFENRLVAIVDSIIPSSSRIRWETVGHSIFVYDSMQEFLFDSERSRICCRCCSWAGDGTCALLLREFKCWGGGNDCLRRRLNAGLRLYFSLAWIKSSLNTCEMFKFSFADTSTKPFSHFIVTNSLVLSVSTWKYTFDCGASINYTWNQSFKWNYILNIYIDNCS